MGTDGRLRSGAVPEMMLSLVPRGASRPMVCNANLLSDVVGTRWEKKPAGTRNLGVMRQAPSLGL